MGRDIEEYRLDEYESIKINEDFWCLYNVIPNNQIQGFINLGRTLFICALLTTAAIYFTKDANDLVLTPIERMVEKIKIIAENPLAVANEDEFAKYSVLHLVHKEEEDNKKKGCCG